MSSPDPVDAMVWATKEEAEEVRDALIENARMEEELFGTPTAGHYSSDLEVVEIDDQWVLYDSEYDIYYYVYVCRDCGDPHCDWTEYVPKVSAEDATHFQRLDEPATREEMQELDDYSDAGEWMTAEDARNNMLDTVPRPTRHRPYKNQQDDSDYHPEGDHTKGDKNMSPRDALTLDKDIKILPYDPTTKLADKDNPVDVWRFEPPVTYETPQEAADAAFEAAKECARMAIPGMESHEEALDRAKNAAIVALNVNELAIETNEDLPEEEKNVALQENNDKKVIVESLEPENDEYESFALIQEAMDLVRQGFEALGEKDRAKAFQAARDAAAKVLEAQAAAKDDDQKAFARLAADYVAALVRAIITANLPEPEPEPAPPPGPPPPPGEPEEETQVDLEDLLERLEAGSETEQLVSEAKDIFDNFHIPLIDDAAEPSLTEAERDVIMEAAEELTQKIVNLVIEARDKANMKDVNDREAVRLGQDIAEQALNATKEYNTDYAEQLEIILYLLELREDEKEWGLWNEDEMKFYRPGVQTGKPYLFPTELEAQDYLDTYPDMADDWEVMEYKGDGYEEFKQEELPEPDWPEFKKAWDETMTPDVEVPEIEEPEEPDGPLPEPKMTTMDLCQEIEEKREQQQEQQEQEPSEPPSEPPSGGPSGECQECTQKAKDAGEASKDASAANNDAEAQAQAEEAVKQAENAMDAGNPTEANDRESIQEAIDAAKDATGLTDDDAMEDALKAGSELAETLDSLQEQLDYLDPDDSAAAGTADGEFQDGKIPEPWENMDNTEKIERMKDEAKEMAKSNQDPSGSQDMKDATAEDAVREANIAVEMADPNNSQQMADAQEAIDAARNAVQEAAAATNQSEGFDEQLDLVQQILDDKKEMAGEPSMNQDVIDKIARKLDTAIIGAETEEDVDAIDDALERLSELAEKHELDFDEEEWLTIGREEYGSNEQLANDARQNNDSEQCAHESAQSQAAAKVGKDLLDAMGGQPLGTEITEAIDALETAQHHQEECAKYGDATDAQDLAEMEDAHNAVGELMDALENADTSADQQKRVDEIEERRDDFDDGFADARELPDSEGLQSDSQKDVQQAQQMMDDMESNLPLTEADVKKLIDKLRMAAEDAITKEDVEKVQETAGDLKDAFDKSGLEDFEENIPSAYLDMLEGGLGGPVDEAIFPNAADAATTTDEEWAKELAKTANDMVDVARDMFEGPNPDDNESLDGARDAIDGAKEALKYSENVETIQEANEAVEKAITLIDEIAEQNDIDTEHAGDPRLPNTNEEQMWLDAQEAANEFDDAIGDYQDDDVANPQSDTKETCDDIQSELGKLKDVPPSQEEQERQQQAKEETMELVDLLKEAFEQADLEEEEELDALDSAVDAVIDSVEDLEELTWDPDELVALEELTAELEAMKQQIDAARRTLIGEAELAEMADRVAGIERRAKEMAESRVKFVNLKTGEVIIVDPASLTDRAFRRVRSLDTGDVDSSGNSIIIDVTLEGISDWVSRCCAINVTATGSPPTKLVIDTNSVNVDHWQRLLEKLRFFRVTPRPDNSLELTYP